MGLKHSTLNQAQKHSNGQTRRPFSRLCLRDDVEFVEKNRRPKQAFATKRSWNSCLTLARHLAHWGAVDIESLHPAPEGQTSRCTRIRLALTSKEPNRVKAAANSAAGSRQKGNPAFAAKCPGSGV